jgi:hypothetical protein
MIQDFDLHMHSNLSDGSLSPAELVNLSRSLGITKISLTDHDNVDGIGRASEAGKKNGVYVVPGVELSVDFSSEMHICGYFIDISDRKLNASLRSIQEARSKRNPQMIRKLNRCGFNITMREVEKEAGGSQVGRPHFAKVLLNKGHVRSIQEAFDSYLAKGSECYVEKKRLSQEKAIGLISDAGGVAVIAHPKSLGMKTREEYLGIFNELKNIGIAGVEAYSSYHSEAENKMFRNLADSLGLFVTGGSDFHGSYRPDIGLGVFGDKVDINPEALIRKMKKLCNNKKF